MSLLGRRSRPYMLQRVTLVILPEQLRGLDVLDGFPGVVAFGIPLPLDQVLELPPPAMTAMVSNRLDLILLSIIDKVRWGSREVLSVLFRLLEWHEE